MKSTITCDMEGVIETMNDDAEKIFGYKREELIACLWYQTLILNLNAPGNPKFNYYSEQYNNLLDSITPSKDKSQVINEINRYCETNEKLMQFLLDDKIKILIDKAAKNND